MPRRGIGCSRACAKPPPALNIDAVGLAGRKYYKGIFFKWMIFYQASSSIGSVMMPPYLSCSQSWQRYVLFAIRRRWRSFYGIIEIAAGLVLLYTSHSNVAAGFSNDFGSGFQTVRTTIVFTAALGGVFVIVRELDNIWEAWKSQPSRQADGAP